MVKWTRETATVAFIRLTIHDPGRDKDGKECFVKVEEIVAVYPDPQEGNTGTMVDWKSQCLVVKESPAEIHSYICDSPLRDAS